MSKKILIVDDEPHIVELLAGRLLAADYTVITAFDGKTALSKVKSEKPDLIILDMILPDIQGSSICAQLKSDPKTEFVPVILFTARSSDYDKDVGKAVKADAYITKPFQQEMLLKTIKELLQQR